MADNTIDALSVEITSNLNGADKSIDKLARTLMKLEGSLKGLSNIKLGNFKNSMDVLKKSIGGFQGVGNLEKAITQLQRLSRIKVDGMKNVSAGITELAGSLGRMGSVTIPDLGNTEELKKLVKINFSALNGSAQPLKELAEGLRYLDGLQNISIPKIDAKSVNSVVNAISKLSGIDTAKIPQISDGLTRIAHTMSVLDTVNFSDSNVTAVIGSLRRLMSVDMSGQTAAGLQNLTQQTVNFFQAMSQAPHVSENTIRMTEALAQLANAGGHVGEAGDIVRNSFGQTPSVLSKVTTALKSLVEHFKKTLSTMTKTVSTLAKFSLALLNPIGTAKKMGNVVSNAFQKIGLSSKHLNKASFSLKNLLRYAMPFLGIYRFFTWGKQAIELSSDLTEVQNVVDVTFGEMSNRVEEFTKNSIQQFGMSELSAKQFASRFQAMGSAMGIDKSLIGSANAYLEKQTNGYVGASDAMADMSLNLTKLAADMASFYNVEQSAVAEDLESIFTGQTRPLRTYGLDLTQATLQEWAMKNGLDANIQSMSQAEKTMLRYQYVLANTTSSQGDFARTSDTWANQVRILKQSFQQLGGIIGGVMINTFKPFVKALNSVLQKVISFAETVSTALGAIFGWKIDISGGGITDDLDYAAGSTEDLADGADNAAGNIGNATDAAEKLKKTLSVLPFDELNQLASDADKAGNGGTGGNGGSGSGGTGGSGTGAGSGASAAIVPTDSLFEAYESEIKNLEQLGEYIGDSLIKAMKGIDWQSVYAEARNFGKGLADFLNGLISPELFYQVGRTIANSLNTALYALNSFGHRFDWNNFGQSIAAGINGVFLNFNSYLAADTFTTWINGIFTSINDAVSGIRWEDIGDKIANFVTQALGGIEWETAYSAASNFGSGVADFLNKLITPDVFGKIGDTIAGTLNTVISGAYSLLSGIEFDQWGEAVAEELNTFFEDSFDWETAGLTLNEFISGFVEFLEKLAEDGHWYEFGAKVGGLIADVPWGNYIIRAGRAIIKALTGFLGGVWGNGAIGKIAAGIGGAFFAVNVAKITGISWLVKQIIKLIANTFKKREQINILSAAIKKALSSGATTAAAEGLETVGNAGGAAASGLGKFKGVLSALGMSAFIIGTIEGTKKLAEFVDGIKGGNGELSEFGGLMDSINSQGLFNNDLNDKIFELKENLENTNASTEEWRDSFVKLFQDAGVSSDTLNEAYLTLMGTTGMTADSQKLMLDIISRLGSEAELSAQKVEDSGESTSSAYDRMKESIKGLSTECGLSTESMNVLLEALDQQKNSGVSAKEAYDYLLLAFGDTSVGAETLATVLKERLGGSFESAAGTASTATENIGDVAQSVSDFAKSSEDAEGKGGLLSTVISGLKDGSFIAQAKMFLLGASAKTLGEKTGIAAENTASLQTKLDGLNPSDVSEKIGTLNDKVAGLSKSSKEAGDNWVNGLIEGLANSLSGLETGIKSITDIIIGNTQTQLGEHSPSTISYDFGANWIRGFINGHDSLKNTLLENMKLLYKGIKNKFSTSKEDFLNIGKGIISSLNSALSDYSIVTSTAEAIKGSIESVFNGFSLYDAGRNAAQTFANGISSVYIPMPHISVSANTYQTESGYSYNMDSNVRWYGKGGFFDNPAIIGIGEAGKEVALPLENKKAMSMVGKSITDNMGGDFGLYKDEMRQAVAEGVAIAMMNNQDNRPINLYATLRTENDEVLARAVARGQEKIDYRMNPTPKFGY